MLQAFLCVLLCKLLPLSKWFVQCPSGLQLGRCMSLGLGSCWEVRNLGRWFVFVVAAWNNMQALHYSPHDYGWDSVIEVLEIIQREAFL